MTLSVKKGDTLHFFVQVYEDVHIKGEIRMLKEISTQREHTYNNIQITTNR